MRAEGGSHAEPDAPYRGLASFGSADRHDFFGRDDLVDAVIAKVEAAFADPVTPVDGDGLRQPIVFVIGASGAGKSSLLAAGVGPRLADDVTDVVRVTPGVSPWGAVTEAIRRDEWGAVPTRRVVIVDQFEELFTTTSDVDRDHFVETLELFRRVPELRSVFVFGLRSDFFGAAVEIPQLAAALESAVVLVGPIPRDRLAECVTEPVRRRGGEVDDELVTTVLEEFIPTGSLRGLHDAGSLPLLSHALLRTWEHAGGRPMTVADFHAVGGIAGSIEQVAEDTFAGLDERGQRIARALFDRLVDATEGDIVTRRHADRSDLVGLVADEDDGDVAQVIDAFVARRLLTARDNTVEITHEVLIRAWPRLGEWIEADELDRLQHRHLREAAVLWSRSGEDPTTLAAGQRLSGFVEWASQNSNERVVSALERRFIDASASQATTAERGLRVRTRRLRSLVGIAVAFATGAAGLALLAFGERNDAAASRNEALSRQVALTAERIRAVDPGIASPFAVAAHDIDDTLEARSTLIEAAGGELYQRFLGGAGSTALAVAGSGDLLATSDSTDGAVQLYSRVDGSTFRRAARFTPGGGDDDIYAIALTSDATTLVAGTTAAEISVWDVSDADAPVRVAGPLSGPTGAIQHLAISAGDDEFAATGTGDGAFRWDISDPTEPAPLGLVPSPDVTYGAAYSPDGDRLAIGREDGRADIFLLDDDPQLDESLLVEGGSPVLSLAWSTANVLAAGTRGATLRVWNAPPDAQPDEIDIAGVAFTSWVSALSFSPDGSRLVAGSSDATARVWNTDTWSAERDLPHAVALTNVGTIDDGATVVSTAADGTLRVWRPARPTAAGRIFNVTVVAEPPVLGVISSGDASLWTVSDPLAPWPMIRGLVPPDGTVLSGGGSLSPNGRLFALGTREGLIHIVDVTGEPAFGEPLDGGDTLVEYAAFDPGSQLLAGGGLDNDVRIWRLASDGGHALLATLEEPTGLVLSAAWGPAGTRLSVASADGTTYLYDVEDPSRPALIARLTGLSDVYTTAFSPDGNVVIASGTDGVVARWDVSDPESPRRLDDLTGPVSRIYNVAYSADGRFVAGAAVTGVSWLWELDGSDAETIGMLDPGTGQAFAVGFSPTGDWLVGGGAGGTVSIWPTDDERAESVICERNGDALSDEEWLSNVPGRKRPEPCVAAP